MGRLMWVLPDGGRAASGGGPCLCDQRRPRTRRRSAPALWRSSRSATVEVARFVRWSDRQADSAPLRVRSPVIVCSSDDQGMANPLLIITCALTGGIHGKEANPHLPEQPDEIVEQGIAAWRAGAAVLHVHARTPDGANTMDRGIYAELHRRLCAETDAVVQLTTGGSPRLAVEERLTTVLLAPEMCSLNMGLLNFFIAGEQVFFPNHRSDIERFAREIKARGVRPELEVYSAAMLEEAAVLLGPGSRAALRDQLRAPHADPGRRPRHAAQPAGHVGAPRRARRPAVGAAGHRLGDGAHAAPDHDDGVRDGAERPSRHGGQRLLPPRRAAHQQRPARRAHGEDRP